MLRYETLMEINTELIKSMTNNADKVLKVFSQDFLISASNLEISIFCQTKELISMFKNMQVRHTSSKLISMNKIVELKKIKEKLLVKNNLVGEDLNTNGDKYTRQVSQIIRRSDLATAN
jgi:hypothetical protein